MFNLVAAQESERRGWYAVHTRSHFENRLACALAAKGFDSYLPVIEERHQWKDRVKPVRLPLFPGYVFVRYSGSAEQQLLILQTAGAVRVLGFGDSPERIPDRDLESVRILVDSGVPLLHNPFLKPGSLVRVVRGPLRDACGVLMKMKNNHRLLVSIHLLSQSVSAEVNLHDVEVAG